MFCPTCGADVPEQKYCQNCGSQLELDDSPKADAGVDFSTLAAQPVVADAVESDAVHESGQATGASASDAQPGFYQWNDVPADRDRISQAGKAPAIAFVLAAVGAVLGLLGFVFSFAAIPALICCIAGLVLNAGYSRQGRDNPRKNLTYVLGIAGLVVALIVAGRFLFAGNAEGPSEGGAASSGVSAQASADGSQASDAARSSSASSAFAGTSSGGSSAAGSQIDARAFDDKGNLTLYAICSLTGEQIVGALEGSGYKWIDSAHTWMSPTKALVEVQGEGGLLTRDDIARLSQGGAGDAVAYVVMTAGYDSPAAALEGLSVNATIKDKFTGSDDGIVFAVMTGPKKEEYLAAITKTDDAQQTVLVFTKKAVEKGLFSQITGVGSVKSIDEVWKALKSA